MNTDIQIFEHEQLGAVRCWKTEDGSVVFLASDVAKGLDYSSTSAMTRTLEDDEKDMQIVHTLGGNQEMTVITESGFYHAALKSRVEKAKAFRKWVTAVVLPQIRKTGGYIPINQEDDEKMILSKALLISQKTIEQKNALLLAQQPKVKFADAVTSCEDSILIGELAKLITQNGYEIGRTRLFRWLRENGYIFKHTTEPIQKWVERGIFDTNVTIIQTHHGERESVTTKVTGKGQEYFVNGFLSGRMRLRN